MAEQWPGWAWSGRTFIPEQSWRHGQIVWRSWTLETEECRAERTNPAEWSIRCVYKSKESVSPFKKRIPYFLTSVRSWSPSICQSWRWQQPFNGSKKLSGEWEFAAWRGAGSRFPQVSFPRPFSAKACLRVLRWWRNFIVEKRDGFIFIGLVGANVCFEYAWMNIWIYLHIHSFVWFTSCIYCQHFNLCLP